MAKTRRSFTRRKREKADWVYRPGIAEEGIHGGWDPLPFNLVRNDPVLGVINSNHLMLYDSHAYMARVTQQSMGIAGVLPDAARAEGRSPKVLMVEGTILFRLLNWTGGNVFPWGMRLGWYEQDQGSGLPLLEQDYSMWNPGIVAGAVSADSATFANDRQKNMREWRWQRVNTTDQTPSHTVNIMAKVARRAPSASHCLMMYLEMSDLSSINSSIQVWSWLRALVADPNA